MPIQILSVNKRLRNLGQIQSIYIHKNLLAPQVAGVLEKLAESFLYNFHRKHNLLKLKIKKLLQKLVLKTYRLELS